MYLFRFLILWKKFLTISFPENIYTFCHKMLKFVIIAQKREKEMLER